MKYVPYIVILFLSYFVCIQNDKLENLTSKVNTLEYKTNNLKNKSFSNVTTDYKETFYLTQLSNSTTLILSVIGFSLVIAGLFSFSIIDTKFKVIKHSVDDDVNSLETRVNIIESSVNTSINSLRDNMTKYSEDYKNYESRHSDFEFRLNQSQAVENIDKSSYYKDKNDMGNALYHVLYGLSDLTNCYFSSSLNSDDNYKKEALIVIEETLKMLSKKDYHYLSMNYSKLTNDNIKNIRRLENDIIDKLLSKVQVSIEYKNIGI